MSHVRTRFAPSPTGYLHLGGARTALFAWAYARHSKGEFVLRIEDTDRERSTEAACQAILESMEWLGLDYDEGPIYQTQRFDRYVEVANQLLQEGKAYRCDCSKVRLETLREDQMARGEKPRYDGHCRTRGLSDAADQVIRFKTPTEGSVAWNDGVRGDILFENQELDDLIMVRSDGTPTYNFCVVVDDIDMKITHVIRGEDHVNNTPRQIHLYQALNQPIPHFSHVPTILGSDGKKLSKRHGALSVMEYHHMGILKEALMNYLIRLGWSCKDQEIFSAEEIIEKFSLDSVSQSPAAFNLEKLLWLNQHYLKTLPLPRILEAFAWHWNQTGFEVSKGPSLESVVPLMLERVKTLEELAQSLHYFYVPVTEYDPASLEKVLKEGAENVKAILKSVNEKLSDTAWETSTIHAVLTQVAADFSVGMGKVGMPLRLALTGGLQSPSIDATVCVLGKATVLERIQIFIDSLR